MSSAYEKASKVSEPFEGYDAGAEILKTSGPVVGVSCSVNEKVWFKQGCGKQGSSQTAWYL